MKAIENSPGLDAVGYRAATWHELRESLVARFSSNDLPALAALRARDDDVTIALIDAFAVMGDVLTFYQERLANEAFLRTATDRRSVLELAALLGYTAAPGVAADAWLAFTLQDAPGAPAQASLPVTIAAGTRVQSVPGPGESAQTFETVGAVSARVEHNAIGVQTHAAPGIAFGVTHLHLAGTGHRLQPGDVILVVGAERRGFAGSERWDVRSLSAVEPDDARGVTRIAWQDGLGETEPRTDPAAEAVEVHVFRRRAALFGHNAPDARLLSSNGTNLSAIADTATGKWKGFELTEQSLDLDQTYEAVVAGGWLALADATIGGRTTSELGYVELYRASTVTHRSRTDYGLSSRVTRVGLDTKEHLAWFGLRSTLVLAESERLPIGARLVRAPLLGDDVELAGREEALARGQALAFGGSRQHVRVRPEVKGLELLLGDGTRVALAGGDRLALLAAPVRSLPGGALQSLDGEEIEAAIDTDASAPLGWPLLDRDGRAGEVWAGAAAFALDPADPADPCVAEVAVIADAADAVVHGRDRTRLRLAAPLRHAFARESVRINANVAPATHGETVSELLGSGDASVAAQRFALKQEPLTWVRAADTPSGRRSTLAVEVAGTRWPERATLFESAATDRVHSVERIADGPVTVVFGDGVEGARAPTGEQNVRASYRKGIGSAGNVRAGSLTTLLAGPLGVAGVANPEPAAGGEDPEPLGAARENAPSTVLTLDRAVSLRDYEDFARGFAGIAKAHATWLATGPSRGVFLTVAGPAGAAVAASGSTQAALVQALRAFGDPLVRTTIQTFRAASFHLSGAIKPAPETIGARVLDDVRAALLAVFSFDARAFGQSVSIDEVVAVIHRVDGVLAVDIDILRRAGGPASPAVQPRLYPALPVPGPAGVSASELLTIDASAMDLRELA